MSLSVDIGSIAHRALERWIREGLWKEDEDGGLLRRTYELEGSNAHKDVNVQSGGRLLGLRLKNVGKALRDRLSAVQSNQIFPEFAAKDDVIRISGFIDLLIVEDQVLHVYDYKTGRGALTGGGEVSEAVTTQLTAYGILVSRLFPDRQLRLAMVSPSHGIIDVPYDAGHAARIIDRVAEFCRLSGSGLELPANPDADTCRFCLRRLHCEPHWRTSMSQGWVDVVEGDVLDMRRSDTGQFVIKVETNEGVSWILNVVPEAVPDVWEGMPYRLRGVRLKRVRPEGSAQLHFRANADSGVRISALSHE